MALKITNNAVSAFAGSVNGVQTTITVTPGDGAKFPVLGAGDWFPLVGIKPSGQREIMRCTARTTDTLTVTRAQEGTAALTFNASEVVELRLTAAAFDALTQNAVELIDPLLKYVKLYSGSIGSIPAGHQLCDGTNGTIDLRDRFVVGAGLGYAVGAVGGAVSGTTSSSGGHAHTASAASGGAHSHGGATNNHILTLDQLPAHSHTSSSNNQLIVAVNGTGGISDGFGGGMGRANLEVVGSGNGHSHTLNAEAAHTHAITVDAAAGHTHTVPTLPPYFAVAFIQRISY